MTEIYRLEGSDQFEEYIPKLLDKSKHSVLMSTSFNPEFYNKETVKDAIVRIIEKNINFRVILDNRTDMGELEEKCEWFLDYFKKSPNFKILMSKEAFQHIIIVDEKHLRIEKPHKVDEGERGSKNLIIMDAPTNIVKSMKFIFEEQWSDSEDLPEIISSEQE